MAASCPPPARFRAPPDRPAPASPPPARWRPTRPWPTTQSASWSLPQASESIIVVPPTPGKPVTVSAPLPAGPRPATAVYSRVMKPLAAAVFVLFARSAAAQPPHKLRVLAVGDTSTRTYQHASISHALATIEHLGRASGLYDTVIRTDTQLLTKHPL